MFGPLGPVSIFLGGVVLDRPDQTGEFIAKDLAGGWAYLVMDAEGDTRSRSQGVCPGGLDAALRCAFLSAANQVPESRQITIMVDSRHAHRVMVQLAVADTHVTAAIAGRPVSVRTRPDERAGILVRAAAERAASAALRERERAERVESQAIAAAPVELPAAPPLRNWRASMPSGAAPHSAGPQAAAPATAVRRLVDGAWDGLAKAGVLATRRTAPRNRILGDWLQDLDSRVSSVR